MERWMRRREIGYFSPSCCCLFAITKNLEFLKSLAVGSDFFCARIGGWRLDKLYGAM